MTDDDQVIGWKVDRDVPVLLTLPPGRRLPRSSMTVVDDGRPCGCCGQSHPRPAISYPSDPLLFFAVLGTNGSDLIGRG